MCNLVLFLCNAEQRTVGLRIVGIHRPHGVFTHIGADALNLLRALAVFADEFACRVVAAGADQVLYPEDIGSISQLEFR